jgi:hypothetical protein
MLNKSLENGHLCPISDFRGNGFSFSTFSILSSYILGPKVSEQRKMAGEKKAQKEGKRGRIFFPPREICPEQIKQ